MSEPQLPQTMRAVVIKDEFQIEVQSVPVPTIEADTDAVIKVFRAGLCGSDLHFYRGHQPKPYNFIIGHEAIGEVVRVGKSMKKFKIGDKVIAAFSTSCGDCFYCKQGHTSRCAKGLVFGGPKIAGAQAAYLKVPLADTTCFHVPDGIPLDVMTLMADVLPTSWMVAANARRLAYEYRDEQEKKGGVCVVIGCGPVGLCAITCALTMFEKVFATDLSPQRLKMASTHGATALPMEQLEAEVLKATENRGADAVLEVVGVPAALQSAVKLIRPFGIVSSCGLHTHTVDLPGATLYGKNVRFQFGRCSVNTYFEPALKVLQDNIELFSKFVENTVSVEEAPKYYDLFHKGEVGKTAFSFDHDN